MSSRAPPRRQFPRPLLHLLQLSFTLPPFLLFLATHHLPSLQLACSVFHSKSTSLPPSFSLSIQNNSRSRKRAINLLQWDQSARECQGHNRSLSLLTTIQRWIMYRKRGREVWERWKATIWCSRLTNWIIKDLDKLPTLESGQIHPSPKTVILTGSGLR